MSEPDFRPTWFSKPGDTLSAIMAERALSVEAVAGLMGSSHQAVEGILNGKSRIDARVAEILAAKIGGSAAFWEARQSQFEAALARAAAGAGAKGSDWLRTLPLREMRRDGWLGEGSEPNGPLKSALNFFDVADVEEWRDRYATFTTEFSFRSSPRFETKIGSLAAWLRQGELKAARFACQPWDRQRLLDRLGEVRRLSRLKSPTSFLPRLKALLAEVGVAVVVVRSPVGCRASGAARFISPTKAMIILSFRYLSDDQFWFTVFHELGHIILHGVDSTFIDSKDIADSAKEHEANSFAAGILVPPSALPELRPRALDVISFARSLGVSAGVVVGQLQHRQIVGHNQLNRLKRRYTWDQIAQATD